MRELVRSVRKPPALVGNAFTAMLASNGDYKCHGVCRLPASDSKEDETPLRPDIVQYCPKHLRRRSCWEEEEKKRAKYAVVVRDCSGSGQSYTAFNLIDGDLSGQSLCKAYSLLGLRTGIGPAPTPAGSPGRVCLMF